MITSVLLLYTEVSADTCTMTVVMREDEHPIIAYNKYDSFYDMKGDSYEALKANPLTNRKDYKG